MKRNKKIWLMIAVVLGLLFILNRTTEKEIQISKEIVIDQNIGTTWEVMGDQFAAVHIWSSNFKESKPGGTPKLEGLDYLHRITITERGETIQELDEFDSVNHSLAYHISEGLPGIAKKGYAHWSLKSLDSSKTTAIFEFNMVTKGILGFVMSSKIEGKLEQAASEMAEEFKHYVETGQAHARNSGESE
jgi:hypothetical protein